MRSVPQQSIIRQSISPSAAQSSKLPLNSELSQTYQNQLSAVPTSGVNHVQPMVQQDSMIVDSFQASPQTFPLQQFQQLPIQPMPAQSFPS